MVGEVAGIPRVSSGFFFFFFFSLRRSFRCCDTAAVIKSRSDHQLASSATSKYGKVYALNLLIYMYGLPQRSSNYRNLLMNRQKILYYQPSKLWFWKQCIS